LTETFFAFRKDGKPMLSTFIQWTALILTLESAVFLSKGNLGLSAPIVAELAATKWDYNMEVIKSLAGQNADNWIGVFLLLASFAFQVISALIPGQTTSSAIDRAGLVSSIGFSALIFLVAWQTSHWRARRLAQRAQEILESRISKR
jgi:hypothetical protein